MNTFKNTLFSIYCLLIFICILSCHSISNRVAVLEYEGKFPDESARNIEIIMSEDGQTTFSLYAPLMNKYFGDNPYFDFPEGITVSSYTNGEKHSTLKADYAISVERTQLMEAHRNVVIVDLIKQESILTEKIIWDQRNKKIYSDVEVTQIRADGTINKGDGFEADEKFTKYVVKKPRGEILANDL